MLGRIRRIYRLPADYLPPELEPAQARDSGQGIREALKDKEMDIHLFASRLLSLLSNVINIGHGVFYQRERSPDRDILVARAGIASYRSDCSNLVLKLGEGLAGQVARTGEALHLNEVPDAYAGLDAEKGGRGPHSMYVHPLKQGGTVYGVIEMTSYSFLSQKVINLLGDIEIYLGGVCKKHYVQE